MAVQAWFSSGDVDVAPGSRVVLLLTVMNLADTTDTIVLTPIGMPAAWTIIRPATLTLFGGTQQTVEVEVSPPMLASTAAGPTALSVRAVPQRDPDNLTSAETSLIIGDSFDRRINVLQPALRSRRRAVYDLMLENRGNTPANCRLHFIELSGRLDGDFNPPAAGVEPGGNTLVRLKVRAKKRQWQRQSRSIQFRIDADQPGAPDATALATFVQAPMVPERLFGRMLALAAIAGLVVGGWFGVVRPAIRDAARNAVADIAPTASTTVGSTTAPDTPNTTDTTAPSNTGAIVNVPLSISVKQGETGSNKYTVPAGKTLRITDLVIQNPLGDQGTLVVARNDKALFTYNLSTTYSDVDQPLVTPIELKAGENLVVTVTCSGLGDLTTDACKPNVLLSGVLVDA